jgi:hypothetical protein
MYTDADGLAVVFCASVTSHPMEQRPLEACCSWETTLTLLNSKMIPGFTRIRHMTTTYRHVTSIAFGKSRVTLVSRRIPQSV